MTTNCIRTLAATATAACLLFVPSAGHADPAGASPQQDGHVIAESSGNVSGFAGYVSGLDDALESGPSFGASVAFYFTRTLGFEAAVQLQSLDASSSETNRLSGGTLDSTLATFGLVARFPTGDRAAPYVSGGIAYFSNSFEIDPSVGGELGSFNFAASESVDDVLGFQVGGGIDIALGRRIAVFGEARYLNASADTAAELRDLVTGIAAQEVGEQDLSRFVASAGIRILF